MSAPDEYELGAPDPAQVLALLRTIDGSTGSIVSMMTGLSREELDELGGVPEVGGRV